MFESKNNEILHVFSQGGEAVGVFIPQAVWEKVKDAVAACHDVCSQSKGTSCPEPLQEWETLKSYWDFKYPVCADVSCDACGASTSDWENDEPRRFRLKAANLGGLVRFECLECQAKISKRHFKDHMEFSCVPCDED